MGNTAHRHSRTPKCGSGNETDQSGKRLAIRNRSWRVNVDGGRSKRLAAPLRYRRFEEVVAHCEIPTHLQMLRPLLKLAPFDDALRVKRILLAERAFWSELDEICVRIFQKHLRPYVSAVRRASAGRRDLNGPVSHEIRVECAMQYLPQLPLRAYGLDRMLAEARANVAVTVGEDVLAWLPSASGNFYGL